MCSILSTGIHQFVCYPSQQHDTHDNTQPQKQLPSLLPFFAQASAYTFFSQVRRRSTPRRPRAAPRRSPRSDRQRPGEGRAWCSGGGQEHAHRGNLHLAHGRHVAVMLRRVSGACGALLRGMHVDGREAGGKAGGMSVSFQTE